MAKNSVKKAKAKVTAATFEARAALTQADVLGVAANQQRIGGATKGTFGSRTLRAAGDSSRYNIGSPALPGIGRTPRKPPRAKPPKPPKRMSPKPKAKRPAPKKTAPKKTAPKKPFRWTGRKVLAKNPSLTLKEARRRANARNAKMDGKAAPKKRVGYKPPVLPPSRRFI